MEASPFKVQLVKLDCLFGQFLLKLNLEEIHGEKKLKLQTDTMLTNV